MQENILSKIIIWVPHNFNVKVILLNISDG